LNEHEGRSTKSRESKSRFAEIQKTVCIQTSERQEVHLSKQREGSRNLAREARGKSSNSPGQSGAVRVPTIRNRKGGENFRGENKSGRKNQDGRVQDNS